MASKEDLLAYEEGEKREKSARFSPKALVIVIISTIFVGFIGIVFLSMLTSWRVFDSKMSAINAYSDRRFDVSVPRSVYPIPEFKLPLIKKKGESLTTIVQVKLGIAYEKDNRQVEDELIKRKEMIKDKVQYIIAKKSYEEISTATNREEFLKKHLIYELRQIIEGEIFDIYFDKLVIARIAG